MKLGYAQMPKSCSESTSPQRNFSRIVGSNLTRGAVALGALLLTSAPLISRAEEPALASRETPTKSLGKRSTRELDSELARLPKVSLAEMRRLDSESEGYRPPRDGVIEDDVYVAAIGVPLEGGGRLVAGLTICQIDKCNNDAIKDLPKKFLMVQTVNIPGVPNETEIGTFLATMDLAPLDRLYRKATGNELKYVRLIVEKGTDTKVGAYIKIFAIPISSPRGEIIAGVPFISVPYTTSDRSVWEETTKVIAMR